MDTVAEHYIVNWHTDRFELEDQGLYRIRVLLEGREAGHADIRVVSGGNQLRNAATDETIALLDGRTLPINFRIEEGLQVRPTVPAQAPDTVPAGLFDESNIRGNSACITGPLLRGIVVVSFREGTTQAERQEAIDRIQGEVIGGSRVGDGEGYYYVRVEDDEDGEVLCQAVEDLNALPQVRRARAELLLGLFYRTPNDGTIDGRSVFQLGLSEDGREFVSAEGHVRAPAVTEPSEDFRGLFTTRSLPEERRECRITFRAAGGGEVIGPSVESESVCVRQELEGTIAPTPLASTGG